MDTISLFIQTEEVLLKWQVTKPTWSCVSGDFINLMSVWGRGLNVVVVLTNLWLLLDDQEPIICRCSESGANWCYFQWNDFCAQGSLWSFSFSAFTMFSPTLCTCSFQTLSCSLCPRPFQTISVFDPTHFALYPSLTLPILHCLWPHPVNIIHLWPHPFCPLSISEHSHFVLSLSVSVCNPTTFALLCSALPCSSLFLCTTTLFLSLESLDLTNIHSVIFNYF